MIFGVLDALGLTALAVAVPQPRLKPVLSVYDRLGQRPALSFDGLARFSVKVRHRCRYGPFGSATSWGLTQYATMIGVGRQELFYLTRGSPRARENQNPAPFMSAWPAPATASSCSSKVKIVALMCSLIGEQPLAYEGSLASTTSPLEQRISSQRVFSHEVARHPDETAVLDYRETLVRSVQNILLEGGFRTWDLASTAKPNDAPDQATTTPPTTSSPLLSISAALICASLFTGHGRSDYLGWIGQSQAWKRQPLRRLGLRPTRGFLMRSIASLRQ